MDDDKIAANERYKDHRALVAAVAVVFILVMVVRILLGAV